MEVLERGETMRALIAGGAGFIGGHLCRRFLLEGAEVVCIDNFSTGRSENVADLTEMAGFSLLEWDISKPFPPKLREKLTNLDLVVDLASPASPKDYIRLDLETALANSAGTKHLLDLALEENGRFVLASTSEVYGDPMVHPQIEDYWGNVNPAGPRSCYDESKRFAEMLTALYHRKFGLDTRTARIFNTYGPGMQVEDGRVIPNFVTQALTADEISIYGDGSQTRSFCYIDDMVDGLYALSTLPGLAGTVVNIGNPDERTVREVADIVARLCGRSLSYRFTERPPDDPERRRPDITRARKLLSWEPKVSLEWGLEQTIAYFRKRLGKDGEPS